MRDPDRIDIVCDAIKDYWHKVPSWRLGQLIVNAIRPTPQYPDAFFVEDDVLLALIDNMLGSHISNDDEA